MDSSDKIDITPTPVNNIGRVEIEESASSSNVRPSLPFNPKITGPLFDPEEPLIERLAEAARPKPEQPIAGSFGIEHVNLDHLTNFPPESLLHDDRPAFTLGKVPLDGEYPLGILSKAHSEQPSKAPTSLDSSILKDLKAVQDLAKDQAAIPKIQAAAAIEIPENSANSEGKSEKVDKAEKGKDKVNSKRKFSVAGFFKRRSTTK